MIPPKKTAMRESQTFDSLLEGNAREIARVAWDQATRADQKLDEIRDLIESGQYDRALDEMSEFVGAKKPAGKVDYATTRQDEKAS